MSQFEKFLKQGLCLVCLLWSSAFVFSQGQETFAGVKTVVIDAGHGGKDPGCHGSHAKEKHVCLAMALKLGAMIEKNYPEIKVVYTRKTDVFVELEDRARIANEAKADLFICIHANAASPAAYGTETYVLGLHKTDAQEQIANRENATIYLEDDDESKVERFSLTPDAIIARQIQLSVFLDQSISFANKLQDNFAKIGRRNRGVKQAGFIVLYRTTMPSVLIETGFLTNPSEEKLLSEAATQDKMANAMFAAFEQYKNEIDIITGASQKESAPRNVPLPEDKVVFRVQIETSSLQLQKNDPKFMGEEVWEYKQSGLFKYTVGQFVEDYESANELKNKMREKGFQHAFVVGFLKGERISLEKAINLAKK